MSEKLWYVVTTYSGYENKVKEYLDRRIESMGLQEIIEQVIVPEVAEEKDGKIKMKKIFPGYVLIQMNITDEAWYIVRNTPNVTGFVGSSGGGAKPIPLQDDEIEDIFAQMGLTQVSIDFEVGDRVEVLKEGFVDEDGNRTEGIVQSIDEEKGRVTVVVPFLGRDTDMEMDIKEVRKATV